MNLEIKIFFHVPELALRPTETKTASPCVVYLTPQINLWPCPELTIRLSAELHSADIHMREQRYKAPPMPVVFIEMPMITKLHIPGTPMPFCSNKTLCQGERGRYLRG